MRFRNRVALATTFAVAVAGGSGAAALAASGTGATRTRTLVIATDLPLQGTSAAATRQMNQAMDLYLRRLGNRVGPYRVVLRTYDDSSSSGVWGEQECAADAAAHVRATDEVAVIGPYNSGCAKAEVPVLNAGAGPLTMISPAATNPGLTKRWEAGEPGRYYPRGGRNFGRVMATDDAQGRAAAVLAARTLHVKRVYVLDDGEVYGQGVAAAFAAAARHAGITVTGSATWDPSAPDYRALFTAVKATGSQAVYLGGVFDGNGAALVRDKVAVLGGNAGVKLLAPDGFTGYPEFDALPQAQGAYLTFPGLSPEALVARSRAAAGFSAAFRSRYRTAPYAYSLYAVAALQVVLEAVTHSDGTRHGVQHALFSGRGVTVPARTSVLGAATRLTPSTGDVNLQDVTVERLTGKRETYLTALSGA